MKRENAPRNEVTISEFKTKCLSILDQVNKTRTPILITRHGRPIAEVKPVLRAHKRRKFVGSMTGTIKILDDIMAPVIELK